MMQKSFASALKLKGSQRLLVFSSRHFAELVNWETEQPPKEGSWPDSTPSSFLTLLSSHRHKGS